MEERKKKNWKTAEIAQLALIPTNIRSDHANRPVDTFTYRYTRHTFRHEIFKTYTHPVQ